MIPVFTKRGRTMSSAQPANREGCWDYYAPRYWT